MIRVKIEVEKDNPIIGYTFEKDGDIIGWHEMSAEERQQVIVAFADGFDLFSRHEGDMVNNDLQLRESRWQNE